MHSDLIWLVIEGLLVGEGVCCINSALGDGDIQSLSKIAACAGAVCGIVAGTGAPACATACIEGILVISPIQWEGPLAFTKAGLRPGRLHVHNMP